MKYLIALTILLSTAACTEERVCLKWHAQEVLIFKDGQDPKTETRYVCEQWELEKPAETPNL